MTKPALALLAAVCLTAPLAAPVPAQAQVTGYGGFRPQDHTYASADRNYCAALAELYIRYVGRSESGPRTNRRPDVDSGVALAKCQAGDTATGIPMLERKLTNARVALPPRN